MPRHFCYMMTLTQLPKSDITHWLVVYYYIYTRVFTGNCGKAMGNNTAVYQVI